MLIVTLCFISFVINRKKRLGLTMADKCLIFIKKHVCLETMSLMTFEALKHFQRLGIKSKNLI